MIDAVLSQIHRTPAPWLGAGVLFLIGGLVGFYIVIDMVVDTVREFWERK